MNRTDKKNDQCILVALIKIEKGLTETFHCILRSYIELRGELGIFFCELLEQDSDSFALQHDFAGGIWGAVKIFVTSSHAGRTSLTCLWQVGLASLAGAYLLPQVSRLCASRTNFREL